MNGYGGDDNDDEDENKDGGGDAGAIVVDLDEIDRKLQCVFRTRVGTTC